MEEAGPSGPKRTARDDPGLPPTSGTERNHVEADPERDGVEPDDGRPPLEGFDSRRSRAKARQHEPGQVPRDRVRDVFGIEHEPVMVVKGKTRLGLHGHHLTALRAMQGRRYPAGAVTVAVRTGKQLSRVAGATQAPEAEPDPTEDQDA